MVNSRGSSFAQCNLAVSALLIALFISAVAFDLIAQWTKRRGLAQAAYYNLLGAAISTVPVLGTGLLAWQFQLEGQKLKGILLLHLVLACVSTVWFGLCCGGIFAGGGGAVSCRVIAWRLKFWQSVSWR